MKCPSDFQMEEILGNVKDCTVKEAWDILQGEQRRLHAGGRKKDSAVCRKCHHGAKKIRREEVPEAVEGTGLHQYEYLKDFAGFGAEDRVKDYHGNKPEKRRAAN